MFLWPEGLGGKSSLDSAMLKSQGVRCTFTISVCLEQGRRCIKHFLFLVILVLTLWLGETSIYLEIFFFYNSWQFPFRGFSDTLSRLGGELKPENSLPRQSFSLKFPRLPHFPPFRVFLCLLLCYVQAYLILGRKT